MIVIGLSHCVSFFLSFYHHKWKISAILKASYVILLHGCFLVFMLCTRNDVLAYTSIIYLAILLTGAMHHFIETLI
jgi:hypothetical protein